MTSKINTHDFLRLLFIYKSGYLCRYDALEISMGFRDIEMVGVGKSGLVRKGNF